MLPIRPRSMQELTMDMDRERGHNYRGTKSNLG
jgi:hypothetical protein